MSWPVTLNALATAWPGNGFPNTAQSRSIQGTKTRNATAPTTATRRSMPGPPGEQEPDEPEPDRLVAGQGGQADEDAERDDPRIRER